MSIAKHIDHTCVKADTSLADVEKLCSEAIEYKFATVCVPPLFVKKAKEFTFGSGVKVASVIGFPFGYSAIEAKVAEIVLAILDGADELEMVINTAAAKNNDWQFLASEINTIMPVIKSKSRIITVIFETGLMTDAEMITACDMYGAAGVNFVKAGTGTMENGLIAHHIKLIRKHLAESIGIKVATGIKNFSDAKKLLNAGANRLSCNNSLTLLKDALQQN
jgi:deoxyribose-phosphate aldolase